MKVPDQLLCLFNAEIEERNGSYVVEIPDSEFSVGELQGNEVYRVGILPSPLTGSESESSRERERSGPPVEEGEFRVVEIEDTGEQGDGLARVNGGFVVIVPDAEVGDRVTVEIAHVQDNYAVGEMVQVVETGA